MAKITFNVLMHDEEDGSWWSEVQELPGCFASGFSLDELKEATFEAIQLWLPDGIKLDDPKWSEVKPTSDGRSGGKKSSKRRQPRRALVCA
jgi:predicted RNase H-like HicB family nuclease